MRGFQPAQAKSKAQKFANGGPVRGPGTGTSDEIQDVVPKGTYIMPADTTAAVGEQALAGMGARGMPVNLSNGEFKMPPEQVHAVGVQTLDQIRSATHAPVGFSPGQRRQEPEPRTFFADGGVVEDVGRQVAPYVNHRAPDGPPAMQAQPQLGNSVPPQTGLQNTHRPNFTMGGNDSAAAARPAGPDVSDVRAKYNPANGSPEAQAWQAQRAAANASPAAAATPAMGSTATPTPTATAASQGMGYRAGAALGRAAAPVLRAAGAVAVPATLAGTASATGETPTSDYEKRFGLGSNTYDGVGALARDVGVRALGAASDLGDALTLGMAGKYLYADKQAGAATAAPVADSAPITRGLPGAGRGNLNPATVAPSAPAPAAAPPAVPSAAAPSSDVTRVGNSYSGANISGDITINGQAPRGFGQVSAQNMAAADALAARNMGSAGPVGFQPGAVRPAVASSARGFAGAIGQVGNGNMWSRTPEQQRRDAQTQASSIHKPTAARGFAALENLNVQDALATREAGESARAQLRDAGETGRTQMREYGAAQRSEGELGLGYGRLGTDRARLEIERSRAAGEERARGFPIRAAERLEALQQQYVNSTDETQRAQLARRIREIQGNAPSADWGVQVTPAAKNVDGSTSEGSVIRFNKATGDVQRIDPGQGAAPKSPVVGAVESGYRFKGGDPANSASWEKA